MHAHVECSPFSVQRGLICSNITVKTLGRLSHHACIMTHEYLRMQGEVESDR